MSCLPDDTISRERIRQDPRDLVSHNTVRQESRVNDTLGRVPGPIAGYLENNSRYFILKPLISVNIQPVEKENTSELMLSSMPPWNAPMLTMEAGWEWVPWTIGFVLETIMGTMEE